MDNYYREPWLLDRYAATLQRVLRPRPVCRGGRLAGRARSGCSPAGSRRHGRAAPRGPATAVSSPRPTTTRSRISTPAHPGFYLVALLLILGASLLLIRVAGGPLRQMSRYSRPLLHGGRVPPARDQERRAVRPASSARPGSSTRWSSWACCLASTLAIEVARRVRLPEPRGLYLLLLGLLAVAWLIPQEALLSLSPSRASWPPVAGLRADLRRQPRVRSALPGGTLEHHGVRGQPARGDGRRHDRVRLADHRVPVPARRRRRAVRLAFLVTPRQGSLPGGDRVPWVTARR